MALQRSEELRQKFVQEMTVYNRDMFAFLDETGSDRRDSLRRYGYSPRGKPAVMDNCSEMVLMAFATITQTV